jgi:hypothetical protein
MKATQTKISSAILSLQERLGERPEGMVYRLGCSFSAYKMWLSGERVPGGEWMLRILALCPDEETRAAFFLDIREVGSKIPSISRPGLAKVEKEAPRPGGARASGKLASRYYKPNPNRR